MAIHLKAIKQGGFQAFVVMLMSVAFYLFAFAVLAGCETKPELKGDSIKHISFSHDGKKILIDRRNEKADEPYHRINVYDLGTGELSAYDSPVNERWSHARYSYDGKYIVFTIVPVVDGYLSLENTQIATMKPDGSNIRKITNSSGVKIFPSFSHSSKKIIYARADKVRERGRTPAADYDVYEVNVETGVETRLTHFKFFQMSPPYYFPDDKTFIVAAESPGQYPGYPDDYSTVKKKREEYESNYKENSIYKMQVGEQTLAPYIVVLSNPPQYSDFSREPLVSADGKRLFFLAQAYKSDGSGDGYQHFEYSPDGKHRRITNLKAKNIWSNALSPDGKQLAIVYDVLPEREIRRIVIYNTEDGTGKEITLPDRPLRIINKHRQ